MGALLWCRNTLRRGFSKYRQNAENTIHYNVQQKELPGFKSDQIARKRICTIFMPVMP